MRSIPEIIVMGRRMVAYIPGGLRHMKSGSQSELKDVDGHHSHAGGNDGTMLSSFPSPSGLFCSSQASDDRDSSLVGPQRSWEFWI
jgi:hypothetical protein